MNRSFCPENLRVETKDLNSTPDKYALTPELLTTHKCSQFEQSLQVKEKIESSNNSDALQLKFRNTKSAKSIPTENEDQKDIFKLFEEPSNKENIISMNQNTQKLADANNLGKNFVPEKTSKFKPMNDELKNQEEQNEGRTFEHNDDEHLGEYYKNAFNNSDLEIKDTDPQHLQKTRLLNQNEGQNDITADNTVGQQAVNDVHLTIRDEFSNNTNINYGSETVNPQQISSTAMAQDLMNLEEIPNNQESQVNKTYYGLFKNYGLSLLVYGLFLGLDQQLYSYHLIFYLSWVFEVALIFKVSFSLKCRELRTLSSKRNIVFILEILSIAFYQGLGILKLQRIRKPLSLGLIPGFIVTILNCCLSEWNSPQNSRKLSTTLRVLLWIQLAFVSLKADNFLSISWQGVFWVTWSVLAVIQFYCFGLLLIFTFFFCMEATNVARSYQLAGLLWVLVGFSGYSGTIFGLVYGFCNKMEIDNDKNWIHWALVGGICHIVVLALFTFYLRVKIKDFIKHVMQSDSRAAEENVPEIEFKKDNEDLPPYIVMFTPSYFSTFGQSLKVKDEAKLTDIKRKISLIKQSQYRKYNSKVEHKPLEMKGLASIKLIKELAAKQNNFEDPLSDMVDQYKNDLDNSGDNNNQNNNDGIHVKRSRSNEPIDSSSKNYKVLSPTNKNRRNEKLNNNGQVGIVSVKNFEAANEKITNPLLRMLNNNEECLSARHVRKPGENLSSNPDVQCDKLCFTNDDVNLAKQMGYNDLLTQAKSPDRRGKWEDSEKDYNDDQACMICFDDFPDAVIMNCGHGGICYKCALESWKKSKECFMCRGKIERVLHIDTSHMGVLNIRRVLSATKIARDESRNIMFGAPASFNDIN